MADNTVVHIGENSPQQVALKLFEVVSKVEGKLLYIPGGGTSSGQTIADRKWVLDTYAECLNAVLNPYGRE